MMRGKCPLSWPLLRLWLTFIGAGLMCVPILWVVGGERSLYWSSIGFSTFFLLGTLAVSSFAHSELMDYARLHGESKTSLAVVSSSVFVVYLVAGVSSGTFVLLIGGDSLKYLAWLTGIFSLLAGSVLVFSVYLKTRSQSATD